VYLEDSRVEAERPQIQEFQNLGMKRLGGKFQNERVVETDTDDKQSNTDEQSNTDDD
jgi:hypothetical protein